MAAPTSFSKSKSPPGIIIRIHIIYFCVVLPTRLLNLLRPLVFFVVTHKFITPTQNASLHTAPTTVTDFIVPEAQCFRRLWLFSLGRMETNGSNSNFQEKQPSDASNIVGREKRTEKEVFINHAEIAWHERRREWVGDESEKLRRAPREPIMRPSQEYISGSP
ncbi:hypothetical protein Prudu_019787 [Prunus dulcis]|uniref:Gag1-like clamp domain-containing protein n=1 Tax=Prunus dulcis TaxID=3755 RepID=A0A4Y1RVH7_PRUDU|nr:hypothetical protein Prudu_019787 [Prunus dulcis]